MAESEKKEVFISYSTKNADLAQLFCNQLEGAGVPCWIAPRDIPSGGKWAGAITDGLANSKVFALLVSDASANSGEVEKEIDLANSNKNITIIPIRIEDVTLQGAFQYHLSNKQWVNALGDDKFTRFMDAVNAICKVVGKEGIDSAVAGGGVIALARQLANELNSKFRDKLGIINSMFSARKTGEHTVQLFFPLRIGATGVDLIIQFDADKSEMRIYADAASDGDTLKNPFWNLLNGKFTKLLPKLKRTSGARRWGFVELIPCESLASPLTELEPANRFGLFKANVLEFTDKVMPAILDWAVYAFKVSKAIDELESRLKILFPESEWKVGAPERKRIKGFLDSGAIYVYKEKWCGEGADRGMLSLAIGSARFLGGIYVGIVKHHRWLNLDKWADELKTATYDFLGKKSQPGDEFLCFTYLDDPWKKSGISEAEACWNDIELKTFVDYCVGKFEKLKKLENMIDEACVALPALQIRPSNEFHPETLKSWAGNDLCIENKLREIAKKLQADYNGMGLSASSCFLGDGQWNDVYLTVRSGKFDATVAFRVYSRQWLTTIINLDPPDFETPTIKKYFDHFHNNINFSDGRAVATSDLDGGTLQEWMEKYEEFVIQRASAIAPALVNLKQHLDKVVDLVKSVERAIRASDDGWCIKNEAIDLEHSASLAFWHKNWIAPETKGDDFPPVVIRIVPDELCFEDLKLVLTSTSGAMEGLDRIAGACDFAFGQGEYPPSNGFWSKPLDEPYRYTGGSRFEITLADGSEGGDFIKYIRSIADSFKKMEPIIGAICRQQNDKDYSDFCVKYETFIKAMTVAIKQHFSEQDGWQVVARAPVEVKNAYIVVFKNEWQMEGETRGLLSFVVEGKMRLDGLWFGIVKSTNKIILPDEKLKLIREELSKLCGEGKNTEVNWYPYWRPSEVEFSITGACNRKLSSKDKLDKICAYFSNVFLNMKEATPLIDKVVTELRSNSEVKPA